jgi:hypothetical protein
MCLAGSNYLVTALLILLLEGLPRGLCCPHIEALVGMVLASESTTILESQTVPKCGGQECLLCPVLASQAEKHKFSGGKFSS